MELKKLIKGFTLILFGIALVAGFGFVSAWVGPSASAPNGNVAAPVNVGPNLQTKSGQFKIFNDSTSPVVEVGCVTTGCLGTLKAKSLFTTTSSTLRGNVRIGYTDAITSTLSFDKFKIANNLTTTYPQNLCTNDQGTVIMCPPAASATTIPLTVKIRGAPANITSGSQTTLSWVSLGATACTGTSSPQKAGWDGGKDTTFGMQEIFNNVTDTIFTVSCTGPNNQSATSSFTLNVSAAQYKWTRNTSGTQSKTLVSGAGCGSCANNTSFTVPTGVTSLHISAWGAGGGGGSGGSANLACGGGGGSGAQGGAFSDIASVPVSAGDVLTITTGSGGAHGTGGAYSGFSSHDGTGGTSASNTIVLKNGTQILAGSGGAGGTGGHGANGSGASCNGSGVTPPGTPGQCRTGDSGFQSSGSSTGGNGGTGGLGGFNSSSSVCDNLYGKGGDGGKGGNYSGNSGSPGISGEHGAVVISY